MLRIYLTGCVLVEDNGNILLDERRLMGEGRAASLSPTWWAITSGLLYPGNELAEELWVEKAPPSWERSLSALVSKLRALLARRDLTDVTLNGSFGHYQLSLPADVWNPTRKPPPMPSTAPKARCAQTKPQKASGDGRRRPTEISRRSFLLGEEGPWVTLSRSELRDATGRSHECLSEPSVWHEEPKYAVKHAREAVSLEPFRETGYQLLMRAHAAVAQLGQRRYASTNAVEACYQKSSAYPLSSQTEAVYLEILRS